MSVWNVFKWKRGSLFAHLGNTICSCGKKKTGKVGGFAHLLNCDCSRMCRPASRSPAVYSFSFFDILGRFFSHVQTNTTACSFPLISESGIFVMFDLNSSHFISRRNIFCVGGWGVGHHSFVIKKKKKR